MVVKKIKVIQKICQNEHRSELLKYFGAKEVRYRSKCTVFFLVDNVNKIGCSPHILCRDVDDIFCAFDSKDEMDKFFQNLNKVHSSVSFSKEVEADGQLAYLDVLLTKNEKGIETTIYRKNTHTGLYNKWESLSPIQYKKVPYKAYYIVPTKFAAHTN